MRPVVVKPFRNGEVELFTALLCDGYLVEHAGSVEALLAVMDERAHPGHRLFATLDDVDQAAYTSGHAIGKHDLDSIEGHDLSGLDPAAFEENGQHRDWPTTTSEFFIRRTNLSRKAEAVAFADLGKTIFWGSDRAEGWDFFEANAADSAVLNQRVYIQAVPVDHAWEAICAFPNGYFAGDLDPMQVFALARHFEQTYGYELFGIGASYIGLRRTREVSEAEVRAIARDFVFLHDKIDEPDVESRVADVIRARPFFLICYAT